MTADPNDIPTLIALALIVWAGSGIALRRAHVRARRVVRTRK